MARDVLFPGLRVLGGSQAAYSSKVSWTQANGYFITAALLCFKWAQEGLQPGLDRYVLYALMATHTSTGLAYAKKGIMPPAGVYWFTTALLGLAASKAI